jgi:hypothetical protein
LASQKKLLKQLIVLDKVIARYAHEPIQKLGCSTAAAAAAPCNLETLM